jgi:hypothetical protein
LDDLLGVMLPPLYSRGEAASEARTVTRGAVTHITLRPSRAEFAVSSKTLPPVWIKPWCPPLLCFQKLAGWAPVCVLLFVAFNNWLDECLCVCACLCTLSLSTFSNLLDVRLCVPFP